MSLVLKITSRRINATRLRAALFIIALALMPVLSHAENLRALLKTDLGDITIELYPDKAPLTVKNFVDYIQQGFYDGTIFHRVKPGFVVQGGGYTFDFVKKETREPILNESSPDLKNLTGTLSMARLSDPDSATSQFFINLNHNRNLNPQNGNPGYTVFGKVLTGMEVVEAIAREPRGLYREFREAPNIPVRILHASLIEVAP